MILFHKPYRVLCQFTDSGGRTTLADYVPVPDVYPAGRLDYDSEGLLVLTGAGFLQARVADPRHRLAKTYWVQLEGIPDGAALARLAEGVDLRDGRTRPAAVQVIDPPPVAPRDPPIRIREQIPTTWIALTLGEGRNRQVRRMTAAVGHPTLRLIREAVGPWRLGGLRPGEWREIPCPRDEREWQRMLRETGVEG